MIKILVTFALLFLSIIPSACGQNSESIVKTGIDVLIEDDFDLLVGKKVGLITNATGVNTNLISTVDILYEAPEVELVALFGPEHGVRGEFAAGTKIDSYIDEVTGLPVSSLYGSTRKPTAEMLENIEVLVYDIQDIGVRSYTYISTMGLAMEAAAEHGIEFVVLDRPNPLGGIKIEGNIVEEGYFSFVSPFPIPYIYGLTAGELALMINSEGWLAENKQVDLRIKTMEGWKREMTFEETGLHWIPTSPHIPHAHSPYYYVSTGIMGELGVISEGVGFTTPFQMLGAEWIDEAKVTQKLNELELPGVEFRPVVFKPFYGRDAGKTLHGSAIHFTDYSKAELMLIQFWFMQVHHDLFPEKSIFEIGNSRWNMFDKVNGTDKIRTFFSENYEVADIRNFLNKDLDEFRQKSSQYYLYK